MQFTPDCICKSTQLSIKFQLCIKTKMMKNKVFFLSYFKLSDDVFVLLINFKMPTIVGILKFIGRIDFMLT